MANLQLAPVAYVDSLQDVSVSGNRVILSFDSLGSNVRLTLSANTTLNLRKELISAIDELFEREQDCEVLQFEGRQESG